VTQPPPGYPVPQQPVPPPGYGPAGYGPHYSAPPGYPQAGYGYPPPGFRPMPLSPGGLPLADFGTRLLARIIDGAIVGGFVAVVWIPLYLLVVFNSFSSLDSQIDPETGQVDPNFFLSTLGPILLVYGAVFVLSLVAYYIYNVEILLRWGTVGKRATKLKIVPLDPAAALTRGMLLKRFAVEFVAGIFVPFFSWIDGLWQLGDKPYQQCLHDKAARTVVVKVSA
jgi:uncharacterized RDD family membrane protein YckC